MGYQETWEEIQADPRWTDVPEAKKRELARFYARKIVKPEVGKNKEALRGFISKNVLTPPKPTSARTRDHIGEALAENLNPGTLANNVGDTARGVARHLVDDGPAGIARRQIGKVSDAAYDVVAKPLGLPTAEATRQKLGQPANRRLLPDTRFEDRSVAEQAGGIAGGFIDPIYAAAPINAFAKGAPAVKAGINLLPKAAPKSATKAAIEGMLGAGATNALIGGATSIGSQDLDTGHIDPLKVLTDTAISAGAGALLGGPAAALPILLARQAAARGDKAALARIAAGLDPKVTDPRVTTQQLNAYQMVKGQSEPYFSPNYDPALPPPVRPISGGKPSSVRPNRPTARELEATPTLGTPVDRQVAAAVSDWIDNEATALRPTAAPKVEPTPSSVDLFHQAQAEAAAPKPVAPVAQSSEDFVATLGQSPEFQAQNVKIQEKLAAIQAEADRGIGPAAPPPRNLKALVSEEEGTFNPQALGDLFERAKRVDWSDDKNIPSDIFSEMMEAVRQKVPWAIQFYKEWQRGFDRQRLKGEMVGHMPGNGEDLRRVWADPRRVGYDVTGSLRRATPEEAKAHAIHQEYERRTEDFSDGHTGHIEESAWYGGKDHRTTFVNQFEPRPDLSEPVGKVFRKLIKDESGSATIEGALGLPQIQAAGKAAGQGVELAGKGYTAVTEGLAAIGNKGLEKINVNGKTGREWLDALEQARQIAKYKESGIPAVDSLRRAFISNYGVSPEVLRLADEASRAAHRAATPMRRQALQLLKELDGHGQAALELAVTEPTLRAAKIREIAQRTGKSPQVVADLVRSIVDDSTRMTQLLREVGAVSESGAARWEGVYLPRTYERTFATLAKYITKSNALKGKMGRGIEQTVPKSKVPEMQAAGWEFRGERGDKAIVWRDYSLEERFKMDQVFHASQAMGKMASEFERDFRNGKLLGDIAKGSDDKGAFAIPVEKGAEPPQGYVLFNNATVKGTGIKRWGSLADHYVREDVAHYLTWASDNSQWVETLRNVKTWTGTNLFKRFKTIWNPAHYVNNFMQNVPMLELAGGSTGDLPQAFKEAAGNGDLFQKLEEFGTVRSGKVAQDLAVHLEGLQVEGLNPISAAGKFLKAAVGKVEGAGSDLAQATDDLFKVAYVQRKMAEGMEFEAAARAAEKVFYDPSKVTAPAAQVAEAFGLPFARVLWYQADKLPELLIANPAKAAVLLSYFAASKALIDKWNGTTDKQAKAREALVPDHLKKVDGMGYLPTPLKDSKGNQLLLNTGNWSPTGFLDNADQVQAPYFPSAAMPGGVGPTLYQALTNHDLFRNKDIRTAAGDDTGRFLMENLGPGVIAKGQTLADAAMGRESYSGLPYDVPTAAAGLFGVKLQPYAPALGLKKKIQAFEKDKSEIEGQIRYLGTLAARNPQDAAGYQAQIQGLAKKLEARAQALTKELEDAQGAFE